MAPNAPPQPPNQYAAARVVQGQRYVSSMQFPEPGQAQSYADALNGLPQASGNWFPVAWNGQEWVALS